MGKRIAAVVGSSLLYATIRYNALQGVAWAEWPTYVVNKAAALSALILIVAAIASRRGGEARERPLAAARWLAAIHVGLSLVLLGPSTYEAYFSEGRLSATAAGSMLLGVLASAGLPRILRPPAPGQDGAWRTAAGACALGVGLHAALLGFRGWADPGSWPGHLVPITLIAFVAGMAGLGLAAWRPR